MYGIEAGLFENIAEMVPVYMPNLMARKEQFPILGQAIRQFDGSVYTIPRMSRSSTDAVGQVYIRTDYLVELGLDMPQTIDNFYNTLVAIKDSGLTQGRAPLVPFSGGHMITAMAEFFFPAFGDQHVHAFADRGDGTLVYNYTSDQFRRYVEFMNLLYREGLLEPEVYTNTDFAANSARIKMGTGAVGTGNFGTFMPEDALPNGGYMDHMIPLTSQWSNERKLPSTPHNVVSTAGGFRAGSENTRIWLRILDLAYTQDEVAPGSGIDAASINMGFRGISYELDEANGTFQILMPAGYNGGIWQWLRRYHVWAFAWGVYEFPWINNTNPNQEARERGMANHNHPFTKPAQYMNLLRHTDYEAGWIGTREADIARFMEMFVAQMITSSAGVTDALWNQFVTQINLIGIDVVLRAKQMAYDRFRDI
jgi:putative aldouronate transport system substrate-binding protein